MPPSQNQVLKDSRLRSVLKGVTWRIISTITTIFIAWWIIGDTQMALQIGGIEVFAKFAVYYVHERAWANVRLGTIRRLFQRG